jgi:hypothetical protein
VFETFDAQDVHARAAALNRSSRHDVGGPISRRGARSASGTITYAGP